MLQSITTTTVSQPKTPKPVRAGMGSHESQRSETKVWLTPPFILKALGPFDLDPCACSEPRPWPTAAKHFTVEDNGLVQEWHGRVWLNPPYTGKVAENFMERLVHHGQGTALIFARTETAWFHRLCWARAKSMLFLKKRLTFHRPDGTPGDGGAGAPSVLIAYGEKDSILLGSSGIPGYHVILR